MDRLHDGAGEGRRGVNAYVRACIIVHFRSRNVDMIRVRIVLVNPTEFSCSHISVE